MSEATREPLSPSECRRAAVELVEGGTIYLESVGHLVQVVDQLDEDDEFATRVVGAEDDENPHDEVRVAVTLR